MAEEQTTQELTLYDAERASEQGDVSPAQAHTNGSTPDAVELVETDDEQALRSLIFQTSDVVEKLLTIPEWAVRGPDGKKRIVQVLVRALPARERAQFLQSQQARLDFAKAYPDLVILTARHPVTKKLLFKPGDRDELNKKSGRAIERIALCAADISGLSEQALNDMKKN